jgi:DNA-binding MarR family transcriptional regulator
MASERHSPEGATLTALVLEIFRLNGRLLSAGDKLAADLGLTSARWQVLGAIQFADGPQTVSWLARSMGLTRQAVQRIVNELEAEGLVAFKTNPTHRRAHLVTMTRQGRSVYAAVDRRQAPWINALAKGLGHAELERARALLSAIRGRLEPADGEG